MHTPFAACTPHLHAVRTPPHERHRVGDGQLDLVMVGKGHLADPHWSYHAAVELGVERPSWTLPVPYAHWLECYGVTP